MLDAQYRLLGITKSHDSVANGLNSLINVVTI